MHCLMRNTPQLNMWNLKILPLIYWKQIQISMTLALNQNYLIHANFGLGS